MVFLWVYQKQRAWISLKDTGSCAACLGLTVTRVVPIWVDRTKHLPVQQVEKYFKQPEKVPICLWHATELAFKLEYIIRCVHRITTDVYCDSQTCSRLAWHRAQYLWFQSAVNQPDLWAWIAALVPQLTNDVVLTLSMYVALRHNYHAIAPLETVRFRWKLYEISGSSNGVLSIWSLHTSLRHGRALWFVVLGFSYRLASFGMKIWSLR